MTRAGRPGALWLRASITCALAGALLVGIGCGEDDPVDDGSGDTPAESVVGLRIVREVGGALLVDLHVGSELVLTALPLDASGGPVTVGNPTLSDFLHSVTWESSEVAVASVVAVPPSLGQETAIAIISLNAPGEAAITATYGASADSVTLEVIDP